MKRRGTSVKARVCRHHPDPDDPDLDRDHGPDRLQLRPSLLCTGRLEEWLHTGALRALLLADLPHTG